MQFDIFLSYNWDSKDLVKSLYQKLTNDLNYRVWLDDNQLDSRSLFEQLCEGINLSKCVLCIVTKKYASSDNCVREINFASSCRKPLVVVMLERLEIVELGSVGFIIAPLTRFNFYKQDPQMMWSGLMFENFLKSLQLNISGVQNEKTKMLTNTLNVALKFSNAKKSTKENEKSIADDFIEGKITFLKESLGCYNGDLKEGQIKEGKGIFCFNNGDKYEGEWKNNLMNGKGKFSYNDGEVYTGEYLNGKKHGHGEYFFSDSKYYIGQFYDDHLNGTGEFVYSNGDRYIGEFSNGKRHGNGKYIYSEGDYYTGSWVDNKESGYGIYAYENGDVYEGEFFDGKSEGKGVLKFINGERFEGEYVNGKKHGKGVYFYKNGTKYVGDWENNEKSGHGRIEFEDGAWYEGSFKNGNFHGHGTYHYTTGYTYEGEWFNGSKKIEMND